MNNPKDKDYIKAKNRKTFDLDTVPDRIVEGIKNAKMDPKYNYLNKLLDDDK